MPTLRSHGVSVETDDAGFLLNGAQWTPEIAEALAREAGVATLTDRHWKVIALCREDAASGGFRPDPGRIEKLSGIREAELTRLFPSEPAILIARIAGLPQPRKEGAAGGEPEEYQS